MAARTPVISTNTGGLPEVNLDGVTGLLSDVGDVDDMSNNAISILKDEFSQINRIGNQENIMQGKFLHSMLSRVSNLNTVKIETVIGGIKNVIKNEYPDIVDIEKCLIKISDILTSPQTKQFFYLSPEAQIYQEKEFVDKYGHTKRMDRLIITKKEVIIIDYKSSQENKEQSIAQILEYKNIASLIYPKRKINAYLIYMDNMKAEKV